MGYHFINEAPDPSFGNDYGEHDDDQKVFENNDYGDQNDDYGDEQNVEFSENWSYSRKRKCPKCGMQVVSTYNSILQIKKRKMIFNFTNFFPASNEKALKKLYW